jgi:hypothetical protein
VKFGVINTISSGSPKRPKFSNKSSIIEPILKKWTLFVPSGNFLLVSYIYNNPALPSFFKISPVNAVYTKNIVNA